MKYASVEIERGEHASRITVHYHLPHKPFMQAIMHISSTADAEGVARALISLGQHVLDTINQPDHHTQEPS